MFTATPGRQRAGGRRCRDEFFAARRAPGLPGI